MTICAVEGGGCGLVCTSRLQRTAGTFGVGVAWGILAALVPAVWVIEMVLAVPGVASANFAAHSAGQRTDTGALTSWYWRFVAYWLVLVFPALVAVCASWLAWAHIAYHR